MSKAIFIDTTICTACRGCQVACKQWHDLPAEETTNRGTFENPADVSKNTYKLVRMREEMIDGKLNWLFFPEQCRHCEEAPCLETADDDSMVYRDDKSGAIIFTAETAKGDIDAIRESCPYDIPRAGEDGALYKCDFCNDRIQNGLSPACVKTCPTGTMQFGGREEMLAMANKRLAEVKKKNPKASLIDADSVNVIYLVGDDPALYFENAVAGVTNRGISRQVALRKMFKPFAGIVKSLS